MLRRTRRFSQIVPLFFSFFLMATPASAYILPYPSFMPGHKFYRVEEVFDQVYGWWSFGNLAQFKHCLKRADKKLVEAKVLFEYGQLSLGVGALEKHRLYLNQAFWALKNAEEEGKSVSQKKEVFEEALGKHQEVLVGFLNQVPETVFWQEERKEGQVLAIRKEINLSQARIEEIAWQLEKL